MVPSPKRFCVVLWDGKRESSQVVVAAGTDEALTMVERAGYHYIAADVRDQQYGGAVLARFNAPRTSVESQHYIDTGEWPRAALKRLTKPREVRS